MARLRNVLARKLQAHHAFNEITPVPKIFVISEEINVISWEILMVIVRRFMSALGSMLMNTLTPMVATIPTGKGFCSWNSEGKRAGQRTH